MIPFLPTRTVKKKFQQLVNNRFAIYSDIDHILHIRSLKAFATSINAQHFFIPNKGHFGKQANIQEIPEIMEIIRPYLTHL
jgi:predicted alpha/beta hydrolase family esterase